MLVVMHSQASPQEILHVCSIVDALGFTPHRLPGQQRTVIGVTGNEGALSAGPFENLPGVAEVIRVSKPYKLVSREFHPADTIVTMPCTGARIGGDSVSVIAGPCSIESRDQAFAVAESVARSGVQFFRGGAFKPRTSPYSFQGLGEEALRIMAEVRERYHLAIVTEAVDGESLELVARYGDMVQIGARNMQNFALLKLAGKCGRPVLLKRGLSATLEELLMAAEYILSSGNPQVVLCERGVRTFSDHTRNTLDLSIIPAVQRLSHLPIIVDPSHGTGQRDKVVPMARAAVAAGAHGVMVEVHCDPDRALSDGPQSILPEQLSSMMRDLERVAPVAGRHLVRAEGAKVAVR
ncbi:MAG: 3-deoxy-7-phosphoheptulonate synthase [Terriglobales bacterium]